MIQKKIREAEEVCSQDKTSDGCKVAWDEVEEISAAKSHLRLQLMHSGDPLQSFCQEHPETEECRTYQD
uniref:CP12 domain-containing protein n=2 Tax=Chenopodium quinoa TaxID=63459 RepID=A0A803N6K4_CHEQI